MPVPNNTQLSYASSIVFLVCYVLNNSVVIIIIATFVYKIDYHLYDMYNINACIDLYDNQKHSTYI